MDAAALGGSIIAVLTQLISKAAEKIGVALPPIVKQLLALALATGFINLSTLAPFSGVLLLGVDVTGVLNALVMWAVSMFAHDVAGRAAPARATSR